MWNLKRRRGFSLIELLIVIAIILIIITIALPRLTRARMYTQEVAAIAAIRTIHTAQTQYYSQFNRYATSLAELGPPASGNANASAADLIDSSLASGKKQSYIFTVTGTPSGYIVQAMPEVFNTGGSRTFYSDQTMTVHEHYGPEPATAQDPESK
ncbi:MAG TPA: prepilin-type N-terminal cleavage/methylation domain-containing protein [Bryobacteraceae bacterium]|nr:prepilin-type N-terminal cleavage/methylation domain-containing protein [Bryobacteraceae bacterium]